MSYSLDFSNSIGLPEELVPLLIEKTWAVEYSSLKKDGTPVTSACIPFPGNNMCTIDVNTGLTYPWKAERARNNPKVCIMYSEPDGTSVENPPIVLIYGQATVYDSDLQGNTDRYVQGIMSKATMFNRLFRLMPSSMLSMMAGYVARIWIAITPLKMIWWPEGDLDKVPNQWKAPEDIQVPPSDPKPKRLVKKHAPMLPSPAGWRKDMEYALKKLGIPILTVVDDEGYPVPFRTRGSSMDEKGVRLDLHSAMPTEAKGRGCLSFHTATMKNGEMISNEGMTFIGDVSGDRDEAFFNVERQLTNASFKPGLGGMMLLGKVLKNGGKRLEVEASRRNQPVPVVRLPG